jgi:hypothetical protein
LIQVSTGRLRAVTAHKGGFLMPKKEDTHA